MSDFFYLDIPAFNVRYKRWKRYGYLKPDEKENMKQALCEAGKGYCMYCYSRVKVDGKLFANLEHAIEKQNSAKLVECIPNIGLSCTVCNQSFKRTGERRRKVQKRIRDEFEEKSRCGVKRRKQFTVPCNALRNLQKAYSDMPEAEIILQPMGMKGKESGNPLNIKYDIIKMEFGPNTNRYTYSEGETAFIHKHIQRFRLNDPKYRTPLLVDYIKSMIDSGGVLQKYEYNNMIVELFAEKLKGRTAEEKVRICSRIYIMMFLKI